MALRALLCCCLLLLHPLRAATLRQPFNAVATPRIAPFVNRTHSLSTRSPLAAAIQSSPDARASHLLLHDTFSSILAAIDKRVIQHHPLACNIRAEPWIAASITSSLALQIFPPDLVCQSSIDIMSAVQQHQLHPSLIQRPLSVLHHAATQTKLAAERALPSLASANRLSLFQSYHALSSWTYPHDAQQCQVENAMAYRVNGTLYVHTAVTNHPVHDFLPDFQRACISEFVDRRFRTLKLIHPRWNDSQLEPASTLLRRSQGRAEFASVSMAADENPALTNALRRNQVVIDLASDAIVPSNIAILALPMVMTLIPVAFVAELSTFVTLLYIVFTDLLSTLPFVIKGFELYNSARINRNEMVAYHIGTRENGKIELWVARCTGSEGFRKVGIAFLIISMCVTALGFMLEIYAWNRMKKIKLSSTKPNDQVEDGQFMMERRQGPFGELVHDTGLFAQTDRYEMIGYEMDMYGLGTRRRR